MMNKPLRGAEILRRPAPPSSSDAPFLADPLCQGRLVPLRAPSWGRGGQRSQASWSWWSWMEQALLPGIGCAQLLHPPATHSLGTTTWQLKFTQREAFHPPGKHYSLGSRRKGC